MSLRVRRSRGMALVEYLILLVFLVVMAVAVVWALGWFLEFPRGPVLGTVLVVLLVPVLVSLVAELRAQGRRAEAWARSSEEWRAFVATCEALASLLPEGAAWDTRSGFGGPVNDVDLQAAGLAFQKAFDARLGPSLAPTDTCLLRRRGATWVLAVVSPEGEERTWHTGPLARRRPTPAAG